MVFTSSFVLTLKPLSFCEMNQSVILLFCMNITYNYTPAPKGGDIIFDHYVSVCLLVTKFCHIFSENINCRCLKFLHSLSNMPNGGIHFLTNSISTSRYMLTVLITFIRYVLWEMWGKKLKMLFNQSSLSLDLYKCDINYLAFVIVYVYILIILVIETDSCYLDHDLTAYFFSNPQQPTV